MLRQTPAGRERARASRGPGANPRGCRRANPRPSSGKSHVLNDRRPHLQESPAAAARLREGRKEGRKEGQSSVALHAVDRLRSVTVQCWLEGDLHCGIGTSLLIISFGCLTLVGTSGSDPGVIRPCSLSAVRQSLQAMDESPSWFRKLLAWKDTAAEGQPIVQKGQCAEKEESCYASINGGETADASCVPCASTASRGSVTCPTCQGTGRIPREQEQQLVALIPYGDQRLKPRRTKLYVTITVAVCLLMTCLMMYFLFPRSVAVVPAGLNASSISFDNSSYAIILNMTNMLNVTNNNFYTVRVAQLAIEVLHKALVIGKNTAMTHLDIPPLQGAQILYTVSSRILDNNTYNICTWSRIKVHNVLLHIQGTLTCSYLSHSEQLAFENYQYVDCRGNATLPGGSLQRS